MSCLTIRLLTFFTLLAALPTWGKTYALTAAGPRQFVRLNGYVFTDYGWTASLPVTPKIAAANFYSMLVPIDLEQKYPQIVSPVNAHTIAFNHAVRAYANSVWKLDGGPPQSDPTKDMIEDHELDYSLNSDSLPGVISVTFVLSHFNHQGAHGESGALDFNWNVAAHRPVSPADIFIHGKDWHSAVDIAAVAVFGAALAPTSGPLTKDQADADFTNPEEWAILTSGLRIDTGSYEICSYACGNPSAIIPWSALKLYLNPIGLVHNS